MQGNMISREQVRMARAALSWTADTLAEKAGVAVNTVRRFENGADALGETLTKIQRTFEAEGVEFTNGDAPGVRLRKRPA
jgi:transcriptional regulator with XRE-family HTH domain